MVILELCSSYESYLNYLLEIVELLNSEANSQDTASLEERSSISEIEKEYQQFSYELQNAKKAVHEQYRNVWESCVRSEGLRRPPDKRPATTSLSWKEAVHIQELAASKIQKWFQMKAKQAILEREKMIRVEEARKAAIEAAQAEADRRNAEEAALLERQCSEALVEAMKRKHRGNG